MLSKSMSLRPEHPALTSPVPAARHAVAASLRRAGQGLELLAQWLAHAPAARRMAHADIPVLEFHAEAGAPEGALYVDGRLAGYLAGIRRL